MWFNSKYCKLCLIYSRSKDLIELGYAHKLSELLHHLSELVNVNSRSVAFTDSYNVIKTLTTSSDPYKEVKKSLTVLGKSVAKVVEEHLEGVGWDLRTALSVSAAANIIDTSVLGYNPSKGLIDAVWDKPVLEEHIEIPRDRKIYLILDNAGEAEIDKLLAKALVRNGYNVTILVRSESYEIDVTINDVDNDVNVPILSTPGNKPPIMYVSDGFAIAKGLANAEAYLEWGRIDSLHLFRAKCDVISELLKVPKNSSVIVFGKTLRKFLEYVNR